MERDQRIEYTVLFSPQFPIGWNQAGGKLQKEGKQLRKEKQRANKSIHGWFDFGFVWLGDEIVLVYECTCQKLLLILGKNDYFLLFFKIFIWISSQQTFFI